MINKQPVDAELVKVTFKLPADDHQSPVSVVGDFNDWDPTATPLRRRSPSRSATVTLRAGQRYAFRYLDGQGQWFNDDGADAFAANTFGGHDGVIDLTDHD